MHFHFLIATLYGDGFFSAGVRQSEVEKMVLTINRLVAHFEDAIVGLKFTVGKKSAPIGFAQFADYHFIMIIQSQPADAAIPSAGRHIQREHLVPALDLQLHRGAGAVEHGVNHILPRFHRFAVNRNNAVAGAQADFIFLRVRGHITDHRFVNLSRQTDLPKQHRDDNREYHVHQRSGKRHENFRQRRNRRQRLGRFFFVAVPFSPFLALPFIRIRRAFDSLAGEHLRQLHKSARRNGADGIKYPLVLFAPNDGAETDGKFLHHQAAFEGDPEMAEFVHKNRCPEEQKNHANDVQDV